MKRTLTALILTAGLVASSGASAPATAKAATETLTGQEVCPGKAVPVVESTATETQLTDAFTDYGNTGGEWTGGDSTYSVRLPGNRQLWLFSDTFMGTVNPDGSRPADGPIINNTFVEERGGQLRTIYNGSLDDPRAVMAPPAEDAWYWLGDGEYGAGVLQVVFQRYDRFGEGQWDWGFSNSVLARFDRDTYELLDVTQLPSSRKIAWGSWITQDKGHTYVYGVEDHGIVKYMHVARVRGDDLRADWEFFTGNGFAPGEDASVRVMPNVANEYSVTKFRGMYMLITQDTSELFSTRVAAYFSCSPTGPFTGKTTLFHTPETGLWGSYGDPDIFTYNAHEHPELRSGDRLLVTYNVNSFDFNDDLRDVTIYRPRFVEVRFEEE